MAAVFVFPDPIRPGARIAVVAPSGPVARTRLLASLAWLQGRYKLWIPGPLFERHGYFAGDDALRGATLARAMQEPDVAAIVCARGGYGAARVVEGLPWAAFAKSPKWIVGYSDVTALHVECTRIGVASLHADNAGTLAVAHASERAAWMRALEQGHMQPWSDLRALRGGDVEGTLVGGNLSLLVAQAAAGRLHWPQDAIVVLEDVGEKPYRVDRMLQALRGRLSAARAVVFGSFSEASPNADGVNIDQVLEDFSARVPCPVYTHAPFGHRAHNAPIVLGARARVRACTLQRI